MILTGASETASLFRGWRPERTVLAETSGKNAIIVTPASDPDLAARDVISSAFGHAGQKCSAGSLVILVGAAGKSERLLGQILDAAETSASATAATCPRTWDRWSGPGDTSCAGA